MANAPNPFASSRQRVGREMRYVGTVEWGVSQALVEALTENVAARTGSPFTDHRRHHEVVWLEPRAWLW